MNNTPKPLPIWNDNVPFCSGGSCPHHDTFNDGIQGYCALAAETVFTTDDVCEPQVRDGRAELLQLRARIAELERERDEARAIVASVHGMHCVCVVCEARKRST